MSGEELSRRQFGKRAAVSTALGSMGILGSNLIAHDSPSPPVASAEDQPPAIAEPIPPSSIPIELLLLEVVRQLNPDRKLTHQHLIEVRRDIANELRKAQAIRAVPLTNAHEPAAMFAAYRGER